MPRRIEPEGCIEQYDMVAMRSMMGMANTDAFIQRLDGQPLVYLIHFDEPLKHALHYIGSTCHLPERIRCYHAGNADSARLMAAAHKAEITWRIARVWTFGTGQQARDWEYMFKKGADGKQHIRPSARCPVCERAYRERAAERMRQKRNNQQST